MLNDSGYESPRRPYGDEIKFKLVNSNSKALGKFVIPREIVASKKQTLAAAIKLHYSNFPVDKRLFWAEVEGHGGEVSLNPFKLLCGFLKPLTSVRWEPNELVQYSDKESELDNDQMQSACLFIETAYRSNQEGITKLHYSVFKGKDICVTSMSNETLKEALERDGRFKNISRFELHYGADRASPKMSSVKASSYHNTVFNVAVKKSMQSDKCALGTKCSSDRALAKLNDEGETDTDSLVHITGAYSFSKPLKDLSREEINREMQDCARENARLTLVPYNKRSEYEKELVNTARAQFANLTNVARPAKVSQQIAQIFPSVGRLTCGTVQATCFLVDKDMVITNYHVVDEINKAQRSSSQRDAHSLILVNFNYDTTGSMDVSCVIEVAPLSAEGHVWDESLDYAFLRLQRKPEGKIPLGDRVRKEVPEFGVVSIIGHPGCQAKVDDTCTIIPKFGRAHEINRRVSEKQTRCLQKPYECAQVNRNIDSVKCVHLYNPVANTTVNRKVTLPYDTSNMFYGSSGSPVINMSGEIVAIHSTGFMVHENNRKTSILEYGFTFEAIIEDLIQKGHKNFVQTCFPSYDIEHMDES